MDEHPDCSGADGFDPRPHRGFRRLWVDTARHPERSDPCEPIAAVTLARMRLPRLARFIHWGRPVEQQVRDDPATTISLAAIRPPRTVSTFSIWRTTREMTSMTFGRGSSPGSQRHVRAMAERERRDFHHEFTTLRFRPLSEHGMWEGHSRLQLRP